jgi:hypothetical protein
LFELVQRATRLLASAQGD